MPIEHPYLGIDLYHFIKHALRGHHIHLPLVLGCDRMLQVVGHPERFGEKMGLLRDHQVNKALSRRTPDWYRKGVNQTVQAVILRGRNRLEGTEKKRDIKTNAKGKSVESEEDDHLKALFRAGMRAPVWGGVISSS
ncbi:hypothetical protein HAX54_010659 [Datura stramonium]|uniref:Uncharacterized protein n=1 Tax=Datura stramonium TaxID=4076 RepID=A0ABS8TII2_DATST|nr:hypothetical protein [Datura stramonium]